MKFQCAQCWKVFGRKYHLVRHLFTTHLSKLRFQVSMDNSGQCACRYCKQNFKNFTQLCAHEISHQNSYAETYKCCHCCKDFASKREIYQHVERHKGRNQLNKTPYRSHIDSFGCCLCLRNFVNKGCLNRHMLITHYGKVTSKRQTVYSEINQNFVKLHVLPNGHPVWKCLKCDRLLKDLHNVESHVRFHQPKKFGCCRCPKKFFVKIGLIKHLSKHKEYGGMTFHCHKCSKRFLLRKQLRLHLVMHQAHKYVCAYCEDKFHYRNLLKDHTATRHPDKPQIQPDPPKTPKYADEICKLVVDGKTKFECRKCQRQFHSVNLVTNHLHIHRPPRFACQQCGKTFVYPHHYKGHVAIHNRGDNPDSARIFKCAECSKAFFFAENLRQHQIGHGDPQWTCKCGRKFAYKWALAAHLKGKKQSGRKCVAEENEEFSDEN